MGLFGKKNYDIKQPTELNHHNQKDYDKISPFGVTEDEIVTIMHLYFVRGGYSVGFNQTRRIIKEAFSK